MCDYRGTHPRIVRNRQGSERDLSEMDPALEIINQDDLLKHIAVLASDEYQGRAQGNRGEDITVRYLEEQFKGFGLEPGNPDGTYLQGVPLAGIKLDPHASFVVDDKKIDLSFPDEYVAISRRFESEVRG